MKANDLNLWAWAEKILPDIDGNGFTCLMKLVKVNAG